jgi:hypothetical protein
MLGYERDHLAHLPVLAKSSGELFFAFFEDMMALQFFVVRCRSIDVSEVKKNPPLKNFSRS